MDLNGDLGIWGTRIAHILMYKKTKIEFKGVTVTSAKMDSSEANQKNFIRLFEEPHFMDVEYKDEPGYRPNKSAEPIYAPYYFAFQIMWSEIENRINDPVWQAIESLNDQGALRYDGIAHALIAPILDLEFQSPLRCWNALVNAAYWSGMKNGDLVLPTWEAAIELCKENNWADAQYALEYQMDIYKELQKGG